MAYGSKGTCNIILLNERQIILNKLAGFYSSDCGSSGRVGNNVVVQSSTSDLIWQTSFLILFEYTHTHTHTHIYMKVCPTE